MERVRDMWLWVAYTLFWFYYLPKEWAEWGVINLEQDEEGVWRLKLP